MLGCEKCDYMISAIEVEDNKKYYLCRHYDLDDFKLIHVCETSVCRCDVEVPLWCPKTLDEWGIINWKFDRVA